MTNQMRFIDSSVFLHAYLRPVKKIPHDIETLKSNARNIVRRVSGGEAVVTSLIHISEISNILGARMTLDQSLDILSGILGLPNLRLLEPSKTEYEVCIEESRTYVIGVNDALASILMREERIDEIYSFDSDFDKVEWIKRVIK